MKKWVRSVLRQPICGGTEIKYYRKKVIDLQNEFCVTLGKRRTLDNWNDHSPHHKPQEVSPKNVGNFFSHSIQKLVRGLFLFLQVSGVYKSFSRHFLDPRKVSLRALFVFLKVSGIEALCIKGVSRFAVEFYCLTISKIFIEGTFCCLRVLACAWHILHLHAII